MFVALSRFQIANDMSDEVRGAFCERPHLVDDAAGFLGMEVMSPIDDQGRYLPCDALARRAELSKMASRSRIPCGP